MLAAGTEAQMQMEPFWTLKGHLNRVEEDMRIAIDKSEEMQRALAGAKQAKEAAEAHASAMQVMVQLIKEETFGLGKLLQRADEEIIKLKAALIVSTDL